jgi:hypothetical protein
MKQPAPLSMLEHSKSKDIFSIAATEHGYTAYFMLYVSCSNICQRYTSIPTNERFLSFRKRMPGRIFKIGKVTTFYFPSYAIQ